jgi:translation initiation factor 5A
MTNDGIAKDDVKVPEGDLGKEIQAGFDEGKDLLVTIISAMSEEQVYPFPLPPLLILLFITTTGYLF